MSHGQISGYMAGCREECCASVKRAENARMKAKRHAAGLPDPDDPRHGVNGYSNYGCRCARCTFAWRRKSRMRRRARRRALLLGGEA